MFSKNIFTHVLRFTKKKKKQRIDTNAKTFAAQINAYLYPRMCLGLYLRDTWANSE